jgi:cell division septation protein DedD
MSLLILLLIILAAGIFIREKLIAQDSVQELESQVKRPEDEDQFTFFYTLPDLKMKSGTEYRMRSSIVIPQNHHSSTPLKDHSRPKAEDDNQADATAATHSADVKAGTHLAYTAATHSTGTSVTHSPGGEGYAIQIAALRMKDEAEKIIRSLKTRGYSAYLVKDDPHSQEEPWYRVRIGCFSGRSEAEEHLHKLSEKIGVRGFVVASIKNNLGENSAGL